MDLSMIPKPALCTAARCLGQPAQHRTRCTLAPAGRVTPMTLPAALALTARQDAGENPYLLNLRRRSSVARNRPVCASTTTLVVWPFFEPIASRYFPSQTICTFDQPIRLQLLAHLILHSRRYILESNANSAWATLNDRNTSFGALESPVGDL
jgi:hypothetical protein